MTRLLQLLFISFFLFYQTTTAQNTLGLLHHSEEAFPAYTLFSNNQETYLIDNCGLIVQQWHSEYRPGRSVHLLENGNLLRTAELDGAFPISGRGGRFELFSWEGELLWYYEINDDQQQAHHAIQPLPNGNFLALVWEKQSAAEAIAAGSEQAEERWSEVVYEIEMLPDNQAEIIWEWHLWDHLVQGYAPEQDNYGEVASSPERIAFNYRPEGTPPAANWVHLNAIDYHADLDQVVLSSRLFSEVWVVDHSTTIAEAAQSTGGRYGQGGDLLYRYGNPAAYRAEGVQTFNAQHDVRWVGGEGTNADDLIVFNNEEALDRSAVKTWRPPYTESGDYTRTESGGFGVAEVSVAYTAPDFYSPFMSSAQLLPNGHLFTCLGSTGHFIEVDAEQRLVWEYLNPVNPNGGAAAQGATVRFNQTFAAQKYAIAYPAFVGRDLTPGTPVEINPSPSDCFVPVPYVPTEPLALYLDQNPTVGLFTLRTNRTELQALTCYDALGRLVFKTSLNEQMQQFDLSNRPAGMYFLVLNSGKEMVSQQLVKL